MSESFDTFTKNFTAPGKGQWKLRLIVAGVLLIFCLVGFLLLWNSFFVYVPPGKYLVTIAREGEPLAPAQVLAEPGQKGIQRAVKGEGWHFVLPILYSTEVHDNSVVPPGKVGVVTSRGGKPLPAGRILADEGEKGIQRRVLPPGTYRLNTHGYQLELADAVQIPSGHVGVLRRLDGVDGQGRFAESPNEKGILRQIYEPGTYYLNPKEFEVTRTEVGIFQTTFHYDKTAAENTAITFISKGGFPISLDCTVEWEVMPEDMPSLVAQYGTSAVIERNVIKVQAHAIGRDKGIDYGVQDFLEGSKREKFQEDFSTELTRVARTKNVTVHSAFIRNIVIPEEYLRPIRDKQIAAETELTNRAKEATAESEAQVERERRMIAQRVAQVEADTRRTVAGIDREIQNIVGRTEAELTKIRADYEAQIATHDSQRIKVLGQAAAQVTQLKEVAKSNLYQLKMDVFQNDGDAFLRYSLSQQLNPKMILRLFHSGPGTFWTNLEGKGVNLLLPAAGEATAPQPRPAK